MIKIELPKASEYELEICRRFSDFVVETNKEQYAKRNQANLEKVKEDIFIGKLAECMVFQYLLREDKNPTPPDFMIYNAKKKSFSADLTANNKRIHVKSCRDDSSFPISWVFQPNDRLTIKKPKNEVIALCVMGKNSYVYLIRANKAVYKKPYIKTLNKKVIYETDLI